MQKQNLNEKSDDFGCHNSHSDSTQQGQWQACTAKVALLRCIGVQNAMQCRLAQSELAKKMDTK